MRALVLPRDEAYGQRRIGVRMRVLPRRGGCASMPARPICIKANVSNISCPLHVCAEAFVVCQGYNPPEGYVPTMSNPLLDHHYGMKQPRTFGLALLCTRFVAQIRLVRTQNRWCSSGEWE